MIILGISALDKDSTVTLLDGNKIKYAIAEERFSRIKMHEGFPYKALETVFNLAKISPEQIDHVGYSFFSWNHEAKLMIRNFIDDLIFQISSSQPKSLSGIKEIMKNNVNDHFDIPGLSERDYLMQKTFMKRLIYFISSCSSFSDKSFHTIFSLMGLYNSILSHRRFYFGLLEGLKKFGLEHKLINVDHHFTHAANAFYTSGYNKALIFTLDGYGSGLTASVSVGTPDGIKRLTGIKYPNSLGTFYEQVTSALGFKPSRHEGKIVGLAAYGDSKILFDTISNRFSLNNGSYKMYAPNNSSFSRYISTKIAKPHIAAAYQSVLEHVSVEFVKHHVENTKIGDVVLSGGVFANVKLNQRIHEIPDVRNIFIHPAMGDGGTGTGAALFIASQNGLKPSVLESVYLGPEYSNTEIEKELNKEDLKFKQYDNIELEIAKLLHLNKVVARFNGRMEYGPRALGNRSVLYQAVDPEVNQWLNKQLGRTEFMPFAPATIYEDRHKCYLGMDGAEHAAEFMTITFNCTDWMKKNCPAAVHIDGTARPQLVKKETNPSFYKIIDEYKKLAGIPSIVNTSFNMHEEPIVCTPYDAIRAFKLGKLDYLAINNFLASTS
ncbi:MAG: carbamoyltransferase C-terminal domain-containing protein [Planctomycetota bacterium]|jgi:carbamoyltransferase